jgi:hypothetical protein
MNASPATPLPLAGSGMLTPSRDGLRLIVSGMAYLVAIAALQLLIVARTVGGIPIPVPPNAFDVRDVVALFGWVGLMISGVGVIILPNHLRVRLRPAALPKIHFYLANLGLVGYFGAALSDPSGIASFAFLTVVSASFLTFGAGFMATVVPFLQYGRTDRPAVAARPTRASQ